jgi:NAD(P)-dependent dehydrogenase (short-subunit alcohol dehydrogenase family)
LTSELAGKVVLITGGSRGLGLALARRFGARGARLVLVSRSPDQLAAAEADLRARGYDAELRVGDVRDADAMAALVAAVVRDRGGIDILVNVAGIIQSTPFEHATTDDFEESLRTHFWGPLHTITAALDTLTARRGRIVNVSSIGGRIAVPHMLPYSVGKFALSALSDGLHAELAPRGISVLTVTPGLMRTGSYRNVVVRGRHRLEASWFALGSTTPLTAVDAGRAAEAIVDATIRRQARLTVGLMARVAEVANVLTPELAAQVSRAAAELLPGPSQAPGADLARQSRDLDLGWLSKVLPTGLAREMNQPMAHDERSTGLAPG